LKQVIKGNISVSHAVRLCRVGVISAYPITPQTTIVEELSEMCARGELTAEFIKVESEHSAMAALVGSASTGVRSFTATSSQGLLLMHEVLHWASGARLPIVMANVNRAVGPGWNIWADQTDSISQRDTGWIQIYCESNQEVLDSIIIAYRLAEKVFLPVMVIYDAFFLSHTSEIVDIPEIEEVDSFLPPYNPPFRLDIDDPKMFGGMIGPDYYFEERYRIFRDSINAISEYEKICDEFYKIFGRPYGIVDTYKTEDAELILVTAGTLSSVARIAVEKMQKRGVKVGLMKLRMARPIPTSKWRKVLGHAKKVAVIDRNLIGGLGGGFANDIRSSLYGLNHRPEVFSVIAGLGGRDVTLEDMEGIIEKVIKRERAEEMPIFWNLKE